MSIPAWTQQCGVIPPIRPGAAGHEEDRSPYIVSLEEVVRQFATSNERVKILEGLLAFRSELEEIGIVTGFQWLNGSFMQDVERFESRPPNDIDVVTFFKIPENETQQSLLGKNKSLFSPASAKKDYLVDSYMLPYIGSEMNDSSIRKVSYWYSMWSHRRNDGLWKGFVQVDLSPTSTLIARTILEQIKLEGLI